MTTERDNKKDHMVDAAQLQSNNFYQLRALCDEVMNNLCQAKALLELVNDEDFFRRFNAEMLRNYFYALDTIINCALNSKDEICRVIDGWENLSRNENDK